MARAILHFREKGLSEALEAGLKSRASAKEGFKGKDSGSRRHVKQTDRRAVATKGK